MNTIETHRIMGLDECGDEFFIKGNVHDEDVAEELGKARDRYPEARRIWDELEIDPHERFAMWDPEDLDSNFDNDSEY